MKGIRIILSVKGISKVQMPVLLFICIVLQGFTITDNGKNGILSHLQIAESEAEKFIWNSIAREYFSENPNRTYNVLPVNEAEMIINIFNYSGKLISSDRFVKQYQELREKNRPANEKAVPDVVKEVKRQHFEVAIRILKRKLANENENEKEQIKFQLLLLDNEIKKLEDPGNAYCEWMKEFPESPADLVKATMQRFLMETSDIDFKAKVKHSKNNMISFMNQEYESKPPLWKLCFRAGSNTTNALRNRVYELIRQLEYQSQQPFM